MDFVEDYKGYKIYKGTPMGTLVYQSLDSQGNQIGNLSNTLREAETEIDRKLEPSSRGK